MLNTYGDVLFGGSPFVRWTLSPFLLLFGFLMPFHTDLKKWESVLLFGVVELIISALLAGFWLPERLGRIAFRMVSFGVFAFCLFFLFIILFFPDKLNPNKQKNGEESPWGAMIGLLFVGLPCLWHTLFGRFSFQATGEQKINPQEKILVIEFNGGWTGIRLKWIPKNEMIAGEDLK